ncbi:MAG: hypothetical protein PHG83_01040 [Patescibacteria group bacterium]|nr:hypothetical protein [Patescibacteria group bacterium]
MAGIVFMMMIWGFCTDPTEYSDVGRMATHPWCWATVIILMMVGVVAEPKKTN